MADDRNDAGMSVISSKLRDDVASHALEVEVDPLYGPRTESIRR